MADFKHRANLIGVFAAHRVAANLFMVIMLLSGAWALSALNIQFFPGFTLEVINVRVAWPGASAEDMEDGVTNRLEESLRTTEHLREITSTSSEGLSSISLEYETGTDMARALDRAQENVALVRDLPADIEQPEITRITPYEPVARLLIWHEQDARALPEWARRFERELLERGISRVQINGLAEQEIAIRFSIEDISELGLSVDQLGRRIAALSADTPAGNINRDTLSRQLRSPDKIKKASDYAQLPLSLGGDTTRLGDVAVVERRARDKQTTLTYQGHPAVELQLSRLEGFDSLKSARIFEQWLADTRPALPPGLNLKVYDQNWQYIAQRIGLLLENGFAGLALVIAILFFFLRGQVAFWVAVGIPVSFMAALACLFALGGSINMISLFALIMAFGIIVDDAIVVGEDAMTHYQMGEPPLSAAEGGAWRMFAPVMSSSLTTIAAFVPLMTLGGFIGKMLFTIPMVVICVIVASVIESFLILPGHLRHSFERMRGGGELSERRKKIEGWFNHFREHHFRRFVEAGIAHPWQTLMLAMAVVVFTVGLLLGGRIPFTFLPILESSVITANIQFSAGSPRHIVKGYLTEMETALDELDRAHPGLILLYSSRLGENIRGGGGSGAKGDRYAGVLIELVPSDERDMRNPEFIRRLESRLPRPPELENLNITSRQAGPGGRDLTFQITGADAPRLKQAAEALKAALTDNPTVSALEDDLPYGQTQLVFELNAQGRALGVTRQDIGRQLRAAYDGYVTQVFQDGYDEIEVRVILADHERNGFTTLESLPIILANGEQAALGTIVDFKHQRGFETLRHQGGRLTAQVQGDVDEARGNANQITAEVANTILPELAARYQVQFNAAGNVADQQETFREMKIGALYALALIYLILAWIFSSYGRPLVVMAIIPFAIIGAILGHWLIGIDLTILSLFGVFGLAGIVVNDSIILVTFYRHLRAGGMPRQQAVVEAAVLRLRAVLLTSLTTIAGLIPLLFETSLQAQFLIPMATSIAFGLGFSTVLVLVLVPLLLNAYEATVERFAGAAKRAPAGAA